MKTKEEQYQEIYTSFLVDSNPSDNDIIKRFVDLKIIIDNFTQLNDELKKQNEELMKDNRKLMKDNMKLIKICEKDMDLKQQHSALLTDYQDILQIVTNFFTKFEGRLEERTNKLKIERDKKRNDQH